MAFTISDQTPRRQYQASAGATIFAVGFEFRNNTDIKVLVDEVLKVLNTDYTLSGAGVEGGGLCTFAVPFGGGEIITIYRDMPIARIADSYSPYGPLPAVVIEADLDDATMKMQQLERDIGRSLHMTPGDSSNEGDFVLPAASVRANKIQVYDSQGRPALASAISGVVPLTADLIGSHLYPQTANEVNAGVTPLFLRYPEGSYARYGVVGNGAADDTSALANMLKVGHQGVWLDFGSDLIILTGNVVMKAANLNVPPAVAGDYVTFRARPGTTGVLFEIENPQGVWDSGVRWHGHFIFDAAGICTSAFRLHGCQRSYFDPFTFINAVGGPQCRIEAELNFGIFKNVFNQWQAGTVTATGGSSHGFSIKSTDATNRINANLWNEPISIWNAGRGFDIDYCSDRFNGIHAELNDGEGIFVDHCPGITLEIGYTEHNHQNMSGGGASDATPDEAVEFTANSNFPHVTGGNCNGIVDASLANSPVIMVGGQSGQVSILPHGLAFEGAAVVPSSLSGLNFLNTKDWVLRLAGATKFQWQQATDRMRSIVNFEFAKASIHNIETVTYSASMTPDAGAADEHVITANNGTAFTINAPSNPVTGMVQSYTIRNTSGGALGAATFNAVFKMPAWVQPGNGNSRSFMVRYNGTNWVELYRSAADVPN